MHSKNWPVKLHSKKWLVKLRRDHSLYHRNIMLFHRKKKRSKLLLRFLFVLVWKNILAGMKKEIFFLQKSYFYLKRTGKNVASLKEKLGKNVFEQKIREIEIATKKVLFFLQKVLYYLKCVLKKWAFFFYKGLSPVSISMFEVCSPSFCYHTPPVTMVFPAPHNLTIKISKIGLSHVLSWPKLGLEPKFHDPGTFGGFGKC